MFVYWIAVDYEWTCTNACFGKLHIMVSRNTNYDPVSLKVVVLIRKSMTQVKLWHVCRVWRVGYIHCFEIMCRVSDMHDAHYTRGFETETSRYLHPHCTNIPCIVEYCTYNLHCLFTMHLMHTQYTHSLVHNFTIQTHTNTTPYD